MFRNKKTLFAILIVPVVFFLYGLYTLGDYGINWDEPYHFRRGQAFLQYFLTDKKTYEGLPKYPPLKGGPDSPGFRNADKNFEGVQKNPTLADPNFRRSYYQDDDWNGEYHIDIEDPHGHPPLNGILAAAFNKIFYQELGILGDTESYHLFEITIASFLVLAVSIFMFRRYGIIASITSALALATYPLFLGESHFNIKDPIEAAFYTFTLISFFNSVTKKSTWWLLAAIFSFAAALSVKFNIVFITIPLATWLVIQFIRNRNFLKFPKQFYFLLVFSPLIVTTLFVLSFPTLWKNPIWGIERVVSYYLNVGYSLSQPSSYYLFNFINTYPIIWILITTPFVTLILFTLFVLFAKKILHKDSFALLLILTLFVIIGRITLFGALSYGGVRIVMEFIPILAMIAGILANELSKRLKKLPEIAKIGAILIFFLPIIFRLINLHPNENVYFNPLVGGLSGAKAKNINSWGNSNGNAYYPALLWINNHAEKNAKLALPVGSISNIPRFKLRQDIALSWDYFSGPRNEGEYLVELTYDYQPMEWWSLKYLNTTVKPLYEVLVDEVAIAKVWKNSPEYIYPEYKNQEIMDLPVRKNSEEKFVEITLPESKRVMAITLNQPTKNCSPVSTGYVVTLVDEQNWIRENEDIARDQIKHAELKKLEPEFNFYFVSQEAKLIRFYPENSDACILGSREAKVTFLR